MKLRLPFVLFAALSLVPAAFAQQQPNKPKPKFTPAQERQHAEMLRKYDKNKNGKLDPDERKQMQKDQQAARQFMNGR
ncbi:MAG: hypothetical protein JSR82_25000 [Verrucomicrobia bacterium]|nr:hypothetical protein [Verrucomicrobiota bacterium]